MLIDLFPGVGEKTSKHTSKSGGWLYVSLFELGLNNMLLDAVELGGPEPLQGHIFMLELSEDPNPQRFRRLGWLCVSLFRLGSEHYAVGCG